MAMEKTARPGSRTTRQLALWRQAEEPFRLSAQSAFLTVDELCGTLGRVFGEMQSRPDTIRAYLDPYC